MAEIDSDYYDVETDFTQTSSAGTWDAVTNATIPSTDFTVGRKYLLIVTGQFGSIDDRDVIGVRTLHGSTVFPSSLYLHESCFDDDNSRSSYFWFTVWTAVSTEGISVELTNLEASRSRSVDQVTLFKMEISEDLTEDTDWRYAFTDDSGSPVDLGTTYASLTTETWTPATNGDPWLVMAYIHTASGGNNNLMYFRINVSGGASSTAIEHYIDGEDSDERRVLAGWWVWDLSNTSTSISAQGMEEGAPGWHTIDYSAVFAINLAKFDQEDAGFNSVSGGTGTSSELSTTPDYNDTMAETTWTPNQDENIVILSQCFGESTSSGLQTVVRQRQTRDGTDAPGTQTSDNYDFHVRHSTDDRVFWGILARESVTSAAGQKTWECQASSNVSDTYCYCRGILAWSMSLASTGQTGTCNLAIATASAFQPTAQEDVTESVVLATATATAFQPTAWEDVTETVNLATATATAFQPTATTAQTGSANLATATATAFQPTAQEDVTEAVNLATATATAFQATGSLEGAGQTGDANLATATATAFQPTAQEDVTEAVNLATAMATAFQVTAVTADIGEANLATATATAFQVTAQEDVTTTANLATATATALQPTAWEDVTVTVNLATATATAFQSAGAQVVITVTVADTITITQVVADSPTITQQVSDTVTLS